MSDVGEAWVGTVRVVIDAFGSAVANEYQLHFGRAYPCAAMRPTSCEIDLDAISRNVKTLRSTVAPTPLCAVVKANGYGHGAVDVARTAVDAGASWLAVALVEEGIELREAGIDARVLLLSEPDVTAMVDVVAHDLIPSLYTAAGVEAMDRAAADRGPFPVQLVVDTGMRRVGVEPTDVPELIDLVARSRSLVLDAVWTHCPVADEPENPFTDVQLERFDSLIEQLPHDVPQHVSNSATAITRPNRPASMVRIGIAMYGIDPAAALAGMASLVPAMRIRSEVSFVKNIAAGEGVGYGHRWTAPADTTIATVPIGYADGVRRDLGLRGGTVLIGGRHRHIRGVVTMDQLMVEVGDAEVSVGDEVVLLGEQGGLSITAADLAETLDTIPYEVVCAVSERVPRRYSPVVSS